MEPSKLQVFEHLLADGWVDVVFDARVNGVQFPQQMRSKPNAAVCVGYRMPVPIRDLKFDDAGISGTLSFNRTPHPCFLPWAAIYCLARTSDRRGWVWPESMPADALEEQLPQARKLWLVR